MLSAKVPAVVSRILGHSALGAVLFAPRRDHGVWRRTRQRRRTGGRLADLEDRVRTLDVGRVDLEQEAGSTEKPVVPVPPDFTACIAHLRVTSAKTAKGKAAPTTQKLKSECETQYKALQQEVLGFLISSQWVLSEANSLGVKLSDAEVKKEFEKIKATQFPKAAEFEKFLASSGQTVSDLLLRVKLNLLSQKIQKQIVKERAPSPRHRSRSTTTRTNRNTARLKSAT